MCGMDVLSWDFPGGGRNRACKLISMQTREDVRIELAANDGDSVS